MNAKQTIQRDGVLAGHVLPVEGEVQCAGKPESQPLKAIEDESRRLKRMVADQALDMQAVKEALRKEW